MIEANFFIDIPPQPKRTGTFSVRNGISVFYKNKKTRVYESMILRCFKSKKINVFFEKEIPLFLEVEFIFLKPKSAKKRVHHTVKPDLDNLIKSLLDGLEGHLFHCDQQFTEFKAKKRYANDGEKAGSIVKIKENF